MKLLDCSTLKWAFALVLLVALADSLPAAPQAETSKASAGTNAAVSAVAHWEIPQSVFQIPASPREGRDPFFPHAILGPQPVKPKEAAPAVDVSGFVLNGITSPPKRTAMINGRTMEPGETGEVKLPNGARVLIKCIEIRNESAVIDVGGQRLELKMRFGV